MIFILSIFIYQSPHSSIFSTVPFSKAISRVKNKDSHYKVSSYEHRKKEKTNKAVSYKEFVKKK
jgi:hypothetical protein